MPQYHGLGRSSRPRLLMVAFQYDRAHSMESRLSWQRAQHAAEDYDVTVLCARGDAALRVGGDDGGVCTVELPPNRLERALMTQTATYYVGYRLWHRRVYQAAKALHAQTPFDLVHQVSFCGYREPSDCWRLDAPFIWGPVGGTRPFPWRFLRELDLRGALREVVRNFVNACQLRFSLRVRRAMRAASNVMAANRDVAHDLQRRLGRTPQLQLETGIETVREAPRGNRIEGAPLKILWAGRLRAWKGLPLLLRALAQLPSDCRYTLRILGQGDCQERWHALAERLDIDQHIEWVGWPDYAGQLPHYQWADVFAFTSLRDTSGTGLLEALAAGAPIIGMDHQGAADIMSDECAIRVPATNRRAAIEGFRDALFRVACDADELCRLSAAAIRRAANFHWDQQWISMRAIYEDAIRTASLEAEETHAACAGPREVAALMLAGSAAPEAQ